MVDDARMVDRMKCVDRVFSRDRSIWELIVNG